MARIELREPRPRGEVATRTLLRTTAGAIALADGASRLAAAQALHAPLARLPWPETFAAAASYSELLIGVCLVLGLMTRTAAFSLAVGSIMGMAAALLSGGVPSLALLGLFALALAYALSLLAEGAGPISVDHLLAERARRKAIQDDPIWDGPPYAAPDPRRAPPP